VPGGETGGRTKRPAPCASKRCGLLLLADAAYALQAGAALSVAAAQFGALDAFARAIYAVFRAAVAVPIARLGAIVGDTAACAVGPATKALAATGVGSAFVARVGTFALPMPATERAALAVFLATIAIEDAVGLDPDILCDTELGADQGGERGNAASQPLDRCTPVRLLGDHPRPVIEATFVHALSLLSSRRQPAVLSGVAATVVSRVRYPH
jgi:hypothetical protein